MSSHLESVARVLERPADQLQELDYRPLPLAFVPGSFVTFVVRDRTTGEILEVTLDLETEQAVDPETLRQLDGERASSEGRKLSPQLLSLVLRHASLDAVSVRVSLSPGAQHAASRQKGGWPHRLWADLAAEPGPADVEGSAQALEVELVLTVEQIVDLGKSSFVQSIDLTAEPEIPDQDER